MHFLRNEKESFSSSKLLLFSRSDDNGKKKEKGDMKTDNGLLPSSLEVYKTNVLFTPAAAQNLSFSRGAAVFIFTRGMDKEKKKIEPRWGHFIE